MPPHNMPGAESNPIPPQEWLFEPPSQWNSSGGDYTMFSGDLALDERYDPAYRFTNMDHEYSDFSSLPTEPHPTKAVEPTKPAQVPLQSPFDPSTPVNAYSHDDNDIGQSWLASESPQDYPTGFSMTALSVDSQCRVCHPVIKKILQRVDGLEEEVRKLRAESIQVQE
jgi:hypothetical protein